MDGMIWIRSASQREGNPEVGTFPCRIPGIRRREETMMRSAVSLAWICLLAGFLCSAPAFGERKPHGHMDVKDLPHPQTREVREKNLSNLKRLEVGMSKDEMLAVMGTEQDIQAYNLYTPAKKFSNPYKTEIHRIEGREYEVVFYYTDFHTADGKVTEDELTPLVLREDKLLGWGWELFDSTVRE